MSATDFVVNGSRMRAATYHRYGLPDVLELEEVPMPSPRADEVLVRVHASSVNAWDWDLLRGTPFPNRIGGLRRPKHHILGADIAGRVEALGSEVQRLKPGDAVFGDLSGCGWGGFAEFVCAREGALALKPAGLTYEEAAAVPQAATLALQGLRANGGMQPGQRVLINGAGGGVGTFAVQLAKLRGAEVTGVDRAEKLDMLRSLGTDHVIDFTQADFTTSGRQYDRILDVVGTRSTLDCKRALSPNGIYVMVGGPMPRILQTAVLGPWMALTVRKQMSVLLHKPNTNDLIILKRLIEAGKLAPVIDKRYQLSEVADALRYFGDGQAKGKVVITI